MVQGESKLVHGIILSKDRPAQLHLSLEAIERNDNAILDTTSVLHYSSNSDFRSGYLAVQKRFPTVSFLSETTYYDDIMDLLDESVSLTTFFTDDDIFYRLVPVSSFAINEVMDEYENICCLSLRLGLNTYIQDPYTGQQTQPPLNGFRYIYNDKKQFMAWKWRECPPYMNFGYPLSVDGHIFRTAEIKKLLLQCKFNNPNQQEVAMMGRIDTLDHEYMASLEQSVIINTPLNRVQQTCLNRSGEHCGQDPTEMNFKYLSGLKLDLDSIDFSNIIGCHQELEIKWTTK